MKSRLGLSLFLFVFVFSTAFTQTPFDKFPSFETVCVKVESMITRPGKECYFSLGKKEDGYYLLVIPLFDLNSSNINYLKVWDAKKNEFLKPNLDQYLEQFSEEEEHALESLRNSENNYNFNYIYGYENATTDLINYLEKKGNLTNQELEQLGRAYSTEATDYIHPNISGSNVTATKDLPTPDYEKLSSDRVQAFLSRAEKSLACYQKILANDRNYQCIIIKNLKVKINHDLMHYAMTLKAIREDALAETFLKLVTYTDVEIAVAKRMIDNCGSNGVLITAGDTDSYPLWYVQYALNYKPEITVINYSLLQTAWYFDYIKQTSNLQFRTSLADFKKYAASAIVNQVEEDEIPDFPTWSNQISELNIGKSTYYQANKSVRIERASRDVIFTASYNYIGAVELLLMDLCHSNPEKDIFVTSPWVFNQFNLRGQYASRDGIYEFTGDPSSGYWDANSATMFTEDLKNSPVTYHQNPSDVEVMKIHSWTYAMSVLASQDKTGNQANYEIFKQKVTPENVLKCGDTDFILEYSKILIAFSEADYQKLLNDYSSAALSIIKGINSEKATTYSQARTLKDLYEIFSQQEGLGSIDMPMLSDVQKKVIKAIETKLGALVNSTENIKNTEWTMNMLSGILLSMD